MHKRAFGLVQIKSIDEDQRVIRGIATTGSVDRMGDIVVPEGVKSARDIPLFLHHDSREVVGRAVLGKAANGGIPFEARLPKVAEAGRLRDRVDEAWQSLKYGLITAVSIGFNVVNDAYERMKEGGYRFLETEVLELSLVPIPAQPEAVITGIKNFDAAAIGVALKSIDQQHLAALGRKGADGDRRPGAAGHQAAKSGNRNRSTTMKTLKELLEARTTKNARLKELKELREAESRAFTDEEGEEFDTLSDEVKALDDDIRVARYNAMNAGAAKAVDTQANSGRTGPSIFVKTQDPEDKFPGQSLTRLFIAKAAAFAAMKDGNVVSAGDIAAARWGKTHPNLVRYIKAAVAGGGTGAGEWGSELAQSDTRYNGDFVEFLYGLTVFDRLPLRSVPARVHIKGGDGAATAYWVGESKAIPVTAPSASDVELLPHKVGAIAVCSKELVADSSPSAELWIRDSIAQASAQRVDQTFLSAAAAVPGVSPAGILNGVTPVSSSGSTADDVRADITALYALFVQNKMPSGLAFVTTPGIAKNLSLMFNPLGAQSFPGMTGSGGTLAGDPVYVGDNVGAGDLILLRPQDIWKIGDSGIEMSMSDTAMVEQDSAPTGATDTPTAASANIVSLWQEESIGFKVVRRISWAKRRSGAVQYIDNAAYGGGT